MTIDPAPAPAIACTLAAGEQRARRRALAELAGDALVSRAGIADGERLIFTGGGVVERRLREAVAAEARCCPFLRMELRAAESGLVLDVTGPAEAAPIIAALFAPGS